MSPTAVVDPLQDWRILIKGMGGLTTGATGTPGKTLLTVNATTRLWTRNAQGQIAEWTGINAAAGGPFAVESVVIPPNALSDHLSGGSFYKLLEGPDTGKYISFWSNSIGIPYPNGAAKWGDITTAAASTSVFDRGPGATLATIYRPNAHLAGASMVYNDTGEMHLTLLVDDPNIQVIKPKQTHYTIEFFRGGVWVEVFAGLVWDMDATDTEVVFYGIDYLGLFRLIYDERFDPARPDKAAPVPYAAGGGSKYVGKTITEIVTAQLKYSTGQTDSLVNFIAIGSIAVMNEKVTIFSTMQNTLDFVIGLIDSHRAGKNKMTRISVEKIAGVYTVIIRDNPGVNQDDLLVQYDTISVLTSGYRVIPFSPDWASRVNFIGRSRDGVKLLYKADSSAVDQGKWGRIGQPPVAIESVDQKDLERRAHQAAVDASRLGRQISVGLKLGSFSPMENYVVTDSIPVQINHGAVRTGDYGNDDFGKDQSGDPSEVQARYWTITAVTWESYDDGHWMTNLSLYPKGGVAPAMILGGINATVRNTEDGAATTPTAGTSPTTAGWPAGAAIRDFIYSPELKTIVAIGGNQSIATSATGNDWTLRQTTGVAGDLLKRGAWSPSLGLFVIGGFVSSQVRIYTSPDGISWTLRYTDATVGLGLFFAAAWSPSLALFVAGIGANNAEPARILTSPDGIIWTQQVSPFTKLNAGGFGSGIASAVWDSGHNLFVVGTADNSNGAWYSGRLATSPDGMNWTLRTSPFDLGAPPIQSYQAFDIAYSPTRNRLVMVGYKGGPIAAVATSDDGGITWAMANPQPFNPTPSPNTTAALEVVEWSTYFQMFAIAGDVNSTDASLATSPDGLTWTIRSSGTGNTILAIQWSQIDQPLSTGLVVPRTPITSGNGPPAATQPTNAANTDTYVDRTTGQMYTWSDDTDTWTPTGSPGPRILTLGEIPLGMMIDGEDGADSLIPGPQGATGATGDAGSAGPTGPQGSQGASGWDGIDGEDGADSFIPGPQGATGATGDAGSAGPTGPQGSQGASGWDGIDGEDGADSLIPGPQGATGATGDAGAQGLAGPMGMAGDPGDDGEISMIPGPPGPPGTGAGASEDVYLAYIFHTGAG